MLLFYSKVMINALLQCGQVHYTCLCCTLASAIVVHLLQHTIMWLETVIIILSANVCVAVECLFLKSRALDSFSTVECNITETMTDTVDEVFHFVDKSYFEGMIENFRQQRKEGLFMDVTLKVSH